MTDQKELKDKAISIKGKNYVLVSDRIIYFNETYPNGSITTELVSEAISDHIIIKATVLPDSTNPQRIFTGYSQATKGDGMVNKTAALENAETSAVGRALAMMSIGVLDSVASADEMVKAGAYPQSNPQKKQDVQLDDTLTAVCNTHKVKMVQKVSQKTGNPYWSHRLDDGSLCFGK